jgi:hypothetical protein
MGDGRWQMGGGLLLADAVDAAAEVGFGHEAGGAAAAEPAAGVEEEEGAVARVGDDVGEMDVGVVEFEEFVLGGGVGGAGGGLFHADEALGVEVGDHEVFGS